MDINLTHAIVADVTLRQSWWIPWIPAIIGVIGAIFGAFAGGFATYIIEKSKIKNADDQRRQQAYSQLTGRKENLLQHYVSYYTNFIAFEKGIELNKFALSIQNVALAENAKKEFEKGLDVLREATSGHKTMTDDLALSRAKASQDLWDTIGLIKVLFSAADDLNAIITDIKNLIKKFEILEEEIRSDANNGKIKFQFEPLGSTSLFDITLVWAEQKTKDLKDHIDKLDEKFDDLSDYLEIEINEERESTENKHWYQFRK